MLKPLATFSSQKFTVINRLIIKLGDGCQSSLCILQEQLPLIFRITVIETTTLPDGTYEVNATIFHEKAQLDVQWNSIQLDNKLSIGQLVSIRWKGKLATQSGKIVISRLVSVNSARADVSLFDTVPHVWCRNRSIMQRMAKLIALLSDEYKHVFNTIFWSSKTFHALISSQSFISTMQLCERVMKCEYKFFINIDQSVLILLINALNMPLLHEAIIKQIVETKISRKDDVKSECWTTLLMSLDY